MIGIDTNVLARLLVQDDDMQSHLASVFFDSLSTHNRWFVSAVVLAQGNSKVISLRICNKSAFGAGYLLVVVATSRP